MRIFLGLLALAMSFWTALAHELAIVSSRKHSFLPGTILINTLSSQDDSDTNRQHCSGSQLPRRFRRNDNVSLPLLTIWCRHVQSDNMGWTC